MDICIKIPTDNERAIGSKFEINVRFAIAPPAHQPKGVAREKTKIITNECHVFINNPFNSVPKAKETGIVYPANTGRPKRKSMFNFHLDFI